MAVGKEGMMGGSDLGRRKKAWRESKSPCQEGEMEEREETEVSGGTPGGHTPLFAQQRREQRSAVSEQAKHRVLWHRDQCPTGQGRTGQDRLRGFTAMGGVGEPTDLPPWQQSKVGVTLPEVPPASQTLLRLGRAATQLDTTRSQHPESVVINMGSQKGSSV